MAKLNVLAGAVLTLCQVAEAAGDEAALCDAMEATEVLAEELEDRIRRHVDTASLNEDQPHDDARRPATAP